MRKYFDNTISTIANEGGIFMSTGKRFGNALVLLMLLMVTVLQPTYASVLIFSNENPNTVSSNPPGENPQFAITKAFRIDAVYTYHMLNASSTPPGFISLIGVPSRIKYGPYQAAIASIYYWEVKPNIILPPGTYKVIDSNPATWSYNGTSKNQGFVQVHGTPQ